MQALLGTASLTEVMTCFYDCVEWPEWPESCKRQRAAVTEVDEENEEDQEAIDLLRVPESRILIPASMPRGP